MGRWCAGEAAARGAVGVEEVDVVAILSRPSSCAMVNDNVEFMNVEGIDWKGKKERGNRGGRPRIYVQSGSKAVDGNGVETRKTQRQNTACEIGRAHV